MAIPARVILSGLALNLFVLALEDPAATSRPVRAETTVEVKLERAGRH